MIVFKIRYLLQIWTTTLTVFIFLNIKFKSYLAMQFIEISVHKFSFLT